MKTKYTDGYFNVSKKYGFLPMHICLNNTNFPNNFKVLKDLCENLPIIKKDNRFGVLYYKNQIEEKVKELPNLINEINKIEADNSKDEIIIECGGEKCGKRLIPKKIIYQTLFRYYAFLTSTYSLEPTYNSYMKDKTYDKERTTIPKNIAEPFCKVANLLGCYPWLEYHYSYGLGNYTITNRREDNDYKLEDIKVESLFCGDMDEINFIKVHILINLYTPVMIGSIFDILSNIHIGNSLEVIKNLVSLMDCVQNMNEKRKYMWENSDKVRYGAYRIFLMGHIGNEKIFDNGILYEGMNDEYVKYRGETGAQDDIIPTLDVFTGITKYYPENILTKYLYELRDYRPEVIVDFFNDLEIESKDLTIKISDLCGIKGLIYLLVIINEIYLFRNGHWQFVKKYIMSNTKYNVATGGTPLNLWLPNQIRACLDKMNEILHIIKQHGKEVITKDESQILNLIVVNQRVKEESLKKELQRLQDID